MTRNRIRRRIRAILADEAELKPGLYLFGVTSAAAATAPHGELRQDLLDLVRASARPLETTRRTSDDRHGCDGH